jgi:outer membrane protein TolC
MKMKFLFTALFMLLLTYEGEAQKIITLRQCYDNAVQASALSGEKASNSQVSKLQDEDIMKAWLPSLDANGNFVYNSSVIDMKSALGSLPIPGLANALKPLPHEQYKVTLDVNQTIYDGGAIKGARELQKAELGINDKQTDIDLYKLREQINGCYFSLLLISRQNELLGNYIDLIDKRIATVQSAQRNGMMTGSDQDALLAEKLNLQQQTGANELSRKALLKVLSKLTGQNISDSDVLSIPAEKAELTPEISRPELQLFDLRKDQLSANLRIIESSRLPKAFGFATVGYGNPPGNNFFKNEFAPYYVVGAGLKWNIFDWNKASNQKKIITLQSEIVDKRKNDLSDNLSRLLDTKTAEIESLDLMIRTDSSLIALRKKITLSAESKYKNGTITVSDYLTELNNEKQAVINSEIHKISRVMTRVEYINISGKELE